MSGSNTGLYSVIFSNVIPGNSIVTDVIPLVVEPDAIDDLISFLSECLLSINCNNTANDLNGCISQYINILTEVNTFLVSVIASTDDCGYISQLLRLTEIVNYIINILPNINLSNTCNNQQLLSSILIWLYDNATMLISINEIINLIEPLNTTCYCASIEARNKFIGILINKITRLQKTLQPLNDMVAWSLRVLSYSKTYTAAYVPKSNLNLQINNRPNTAACVQCFK